MPARDVASEIFNSVPVVGHIKGLIHFAKGDKEEGTRATVEATRQAALNLGSDVKVIGGCVSVATGTAIGGLLVDVVLSIIVEKPCGVVKGFEYTVSDVKKGQFPVAGLAYTVLCLVSYAFFGIGFHAFGELTCLISLAVNTDVVKLLFEKVGIKVTLALFTQRGITMLKGAVGRAVCEICKTEIEKDTDFILQVWQFVIICGSLVMRGYSRMFAILF